MRFETVDAAMASIKKGTFFITRSVEAPCGPCWMGADHEAFAAYETKEEALAEVEALFKEHRCDYAEFIMEVVKAEIDDDGNLEIDDEPIRELPDDQYWEDHGDEFDMDRECWEEMPIDEDEEYEED